MPHKLPDLPYDHGALEPHIDARTMAIHHGKHHQAYVDNLNAALDGHPDLQAKSATDLIRDLGALLVRGYRPRDIFRQHLGRADAGTPMRDLAAEVSAARSTRPSARSTSSRRRSSRPA